MDQCTPVGDAFVSTDTLLLGWRCTSAIVYVLVIIFYGILNAFKHYIGTVSSQLHREAMSESSAASRRVCVIVGYRAVSVLIHIVNILLITNNNFGILGMALVSDLAGTAYVYNRRRSDHKHPLRALAKSVTHLRSLESRATLTPEEMREMNEMKAHVHVIRRAGLFGPASLSKTRF